MYFSITHLQRIRLLTENGQMLWTGGSHKENIAPNHRKSTSLIMKEIKLKTRQISHFYSQTGKTQTSDNPKLGKLGENSILLKV